MTPAKGYTEMKDSGIQWIGQIPTHWLLKKAKYCVSITNGSDPKSEGSVPVYGSGSESFKTCGEYKEGPAVLIGRKGATLHIPHYIEGRYWNVDTAFDVKPQEDFSLRYYYYLACVFDYNYYISQTTLPGMTQTNYNNMKLPCPSLDEQTAIASYLDAQCAKIDEIIAQAKASIEDYKQWKASIIYEAVTKGLNPNVEMKDSGIEWIGKIPKQWGTKQIRYLFELRDERNDLPLEQVNLISLYTDLGVVQHSDLEKITGNKAVTADGYKQVYPNDIVVNIILCWMGAIGMSNYAGVTSPAYDVYKPKDSQVTLSKYYHYLFRTARFNGKCYTVGRGIMAMRWRTYSSEFRAIKVPVPSYKTQVQIVEYLDSVCSKIDDLISEKQSLIDNLESYKKSLIYEVVTGKRRVV